jgi:hypothetical protein
MIIETKQLDLRDLYTVRINMTGHVKDLSGKTFGMLKVLKFAGVNEFRKALWLCRCECGKETVVVSQSLVSGNTVSCGCRNRANLHVHGLLTGENKRRNIKLYEYYRSLKRRVKNFAEFEAWSDFPHFYEWSIENWYRPGMKLRRIVPELPLFPPNARWE